MSNRYYIKNKKEEMYIHFNPHSQEYFIGDKLLGAVGFSEAGGHALMRETGLLESEWELAPMNAQKVTTAPRSQEVQIFNAIH